ncbi:MAG: DUF805 domain-containing protein [Brevundimonas sp.]
MRGEVLSYDAAAGAGLISGDDGARYSFNTASLRGGSVHPGQKVDFVPVGGEATEIMALSGSGLGLPPQVAGFDWQHLLFSFNGRSRRSHFWIGWLILLGVGVVAGWLPLIGALISLALIWPNLAIGVKRLHDMGHTGWLIVVPWAVTIIGTFVAFGSVGVQAILNAQALENDDPAAIFALIGPMFGWFGLIILVNLGFLLWIGLTEGTRGPNRFGPDPKGQV